MELRSNWSLSRAARHLMLFRLFSFVFVIRFCGSTPCRSQEPDTASPRFSTTADSRFDTPQSTTAHWVKAVNKHDWREEYNCYTGMQQAKFTYQLMVSTRELSDSPDLAIELSRIFQRYSFASKLLDDFPSTRLDLSNLHDPNSMQSVIEEQVKKRQEQLVRWKREIQPLDIDWAGMIGDLQPLLIRSYQRHRHDVHPSSTGIARHLYYHRFHGPLNLEIVGDRANGSVIPIVFGPDVVFDEARDTREANGLKKISVWFDRSMQKLDFVERRVKRSPEKIGLVREVEGWKIDLVPFR